jgi:hypothetical protein
VRAGRARVEHATAGACLLNLGGRCVHNADCRASYTDFSSYPTTRVNGDCNGILSCRDAPIETHSRLPFRRETHLAPLASIEVRMMALETRTSRRQSIFGPSSVTLIGEVLDPWEEIRAGAE